MQKCSLNTSVCSPLLLTISTDSKNRPVILITFILFTINFFYYSSLSIVFLAVNYLNMSDLVFYLSRHTMMSNIE